MQETFGGDLPLALAAHNARPQTVIAAGYGVGMVRIPLSPTTVADRKER